MKPVLPNWLYLGLSLIVCLSTNNFSFGEEAQGDEPSAPPQVPIDQSDLPEEAEKWWDTFVEGVWWHDKAVLGNEDATDKAIERFEEILAEYQNTPWVLAYLGSAFTLKARDAPLLRKRGWANRGFEALDKAVEKNPEDSVVRLIRAINSYHLPRILNRREFAEEDFTHLLRKIDNQNHELSDDLKRAIYFHAGAFALHKRESKSLALLEKALATEGSPHLEEPIRQSLDIARRRFDES
ncbi:MAG: hypothetical protein LAT55_05745 [Opitutales bacterium]|nr:hypothetical protein [Opitutales bacterium]